MYFLPSDQKWFVCPESIGKHNLKKLMFNEFDVKP